MFGEMLSQKQTKPCEGLGWLPSFLVHKLGDALGNKSPLLDFVLNKEIKNSSSFLYSRQSLKLEIKKRLDISMGNRACQCHGIKQCEQI